MSIFRIVCAVILLVSATTLPLWVTVAISLFCLYKFPNFYELIPIYFIHDSLYGIPLDRFFNFPYVMTAVSFVVVFATIYIRKQLFQRDTKYE